MATALTLYGTTLSSSISSSAIQLISAGASGAQGTTIATTVNASTGWFEIYTNQTNNTGPAGSQGAPTGHGMFFDASTLDGKSIIAGNWTPTQTFKTSTSGHTATCDIVYRIYNYNAGVYTLGGTITHAAQTVTNTSTQFTPSATALNQIDFATGTHVYIDIWMNVTATTCTSGDSIQWRPSSSTSSGWTGCQFVTPGYGSTQYKNAVSRFKLIGSKAKSAVARFQQSVPVQYSFHIRFILLAITLRNASVRFLQVSGTIFRDGVSRFALRQVTAVSLYFTQGTSTTLSNANALVTSSTSTIINTTRNTTIGTAIGYSEVYSKGTSQAWIGGTSAPTPSGNGFISDASTFEGSVFQPGAWSSNVTLSMSTGSIVADVHVRAWKYTPSTSAYVLIADMVQSSVNIGTATILCTCTARTTGASTQFAVGDKYYLDIVPNVLTNNSNSGTALLKLTRASSTTIGNYQGGTITSGYATTVAISRAGVVRFIMRGIKSRDGWTRFRQSVPRLNNGMVRLRLSAIKKMDGVSRFRQSVATIRNGQARLRLSSAIRQKNALTRLLTRATRLKDGVARFQQRSVVIPKDGVVRLKQSGARKQNAQTRFLQRSARIYKDASVFFKIHFIVQLDGVARFRQRSGTQYHNANSRFKQAIGQARNGLVLFGQQAFKRRDANSRFRQSVPRLAIAASRLKLSALVFKDGKSRFRLNSPIRYRDANSRFRQSVPRNKNGVSRFRFSGSVLLYGAARFKAISPTIYRMATSRFRLSVPILRNAVTRFRQSVSRQMNGATRLTIRAARAMSGASRFRQNSVTQYHNGIGRFRQSVPRKLNASARLGQQAQRLTNAPLRLRLSVPVQKNAVVRLLSRKQTLRNAATRFRQLGGKALNGATRLLIRAQMLRNANSRFRQSVPVTRSCQARLRQSGRVYRSGATRLKQSSHLSSPFAIRMRLSVIKSRNATCRLLASGKKPRDGRVRFILRPNSVSPVSAAETEVIFRDGVMVATFRG